MLNCFKVLRIIADNIANRAFLYFWQYLYW